MIKSLAKYGDWESTFGEHCDRTGKIPILSSDITMNYNAIDKEYTYQATWEGNQYHSYAFDSVSQAREDIFRKVLQVIMKQELKKEV